ncbi:hypothetical protein CJ030_MR4G010917 [Morella rubra]|uniref:GRF-type domain-containing protein n=1 Tax=Morella rubra TaxID=262757 RepID=A0A6A1VSC2_9ROSI|nr:hypothetical protein CJ030_MR4G010917 [Morella rubra]
MSHRRSSAASTLSDGRFASKERSEGKLDVRPLCFCGISARARFSKTSLNPGRRFWSCSQYSAATRDKACSFFEWIDPPSQQQEDDETNSVLCQLKTMKKKLRIMEERQNKTDELFLKQSYMEEKLKLYEEKLKSTEKMLKAMDEKLKRLKLVMLGSWVLFCSCIYLCLSGVERESM